MIEVNQQNLYLLLPGKIARVVELIANKTNVYPLEILRKFYQSKCYKELENEETKYWHLGPVAITQDFLEEMNSSDFEVEPFVANLGISSEQDIGDEKDIIYDALMEKYK